MVMLASLVGGKVVSEALLAPWNPVFCAVRRCRHSLLVVVNSVWKLSIVHLSRGHFHQSQMASEKIPVFSNTLRMLQIAAGAVMGSPPAVARC